MAKALCVALLTLCVGCRTSSVDVARETESLLQTDRAWAQVSAAGGNPDSVLAFWTDDARVAMRIATAHLQATGEHEVHAVARFALPVQRVAGLDALARKAFREPRRLVCEQHAEMLGEHRLQVRDGSAVHEAHAGSASRVRPCGRTP